MAFGNKFLELSLIKLDLFKAQNPETGLFDVTFEVEGKLLYAHKPMLNLVSTTFASMFSDRWMHNKDEPIKIKDYGYDDFYQFLTFLYSAQCQLTNTNIFTMVDIAEFYGVYLFKAYCDEYLAAMTITIDNIFKLMELAEKYSMIKLKASTHVFITKNFQSFINSDGFLNTDKPVVNQIVPAVKDKIKPEDLFQAVYKWSEKQAMEKQASDSNLVLNDVIKTEISDFFPHICFKKMELKFLHEFVVSRGFIFSSYNDLSKILSDREYCSYCFLPKIKITNAHGQTLCGIVIPDKSVIAKLKFLNSFGIHDGIICYWRTRCNKPATPSPLKKRDGVEWYLIYDTDGDINLRHGSGVGVGHYLLAELTPGASGFQAGAGCKIEIEE